MSLFKNFWGAIDPHSEAVEQVVKPKVTAPRFTVKDIHEDFYNEVNNLLKQANIRKSIDIDPKEEEKYKKLKELGFYAAKPTQNIERVIKERSTADNENKEKQKLIDAINYFSFKYPNYKFITGDGIRSICEKYGLVYASVDKYRGDIPEKNIEHLLKFKVDEEDILHSGEVKTTYKDGMTYIGYQEGSVSHFAKESTNQRVTKREAKNISRKPLIIAANKKDFDMDRVEIRGYQLYDIEDPVVFQPVVYKEKAYYLIITAWGDEASDELVVNHKMN